MSPTTAATAPVSTASFPGAPDPSWNLWRRQIAAIVRLELQKSFLGRRGLWLFFLAAAPVLLFALIAILPFKGREMLEAGGVTTIYAGVYQGFILRIVIYLAAVAIFGNLIRREILDRSLHYYFLAPLRREVLVAAKFLTGLAVSTVLFSVSTLASYFMAFGPLGFDSLSRHLFHGPGLAHLGAYLLVTVLACLGYGAVFLAFGCFFKSPAIPALAVFAWESMIFLLPPFLKQISVIHYLQSLCPVAIAQGPFAVLADAPPKWLAILGPPALAAVLVALSAFKVRRMEVHYEDD
jgi:ABC-type transport system involved in multi-copper enzyme maturation permease subunit